MAQMTFKRPAALAKLERILAMLEERPRTVHAIADALPLSRRYAQDYLNHLMAQQRIHIQRWVRNIDEVEGMYPRPVYAAGKGANAPAPEPLTPLQRKRRAWERVKADPDRHLTQILRRRKYRSDRKGPRADQAAAWMYGEAA